MKFRNPFFVLAFCAALMNALSATRAQTAIQPPLAPPLSTQETPAPTPTPVPLLPPRPFTWTPLTEEKLPPSIRLFAGDAVNADGLPVKAWYALVDYSDRSLQARALLSTDATGRETTSALARKNSAILAVNGGYFDMKKVPAPTYSLVLSAGRVLSVPIEKVTRGAVSFPVARAALGVKANRRFDVAWVTKNNESLLAYDEPLKTGKTALPRLWNDIAEAVGGGPMLLKNGRMRAEFDPHDSEKFGASMNDKRHPRTALGVTKRGELLMFVVDGRQPLRSMGMTLDELAQTMRDLGCENALNLDGGGSTTFVVNGRVLNVPSDGNERRVTSIFAMVPGIRH